jgi:hypothetical protein
MRQAIAFILFLILACTILPVQETGDLLASNQLLEEVNDQGPQLLEEKHRDFNSSYFPGAAHVVHAQHLLAAGLATHAAFLQERIPLCPAAEILVPPPNCFFLV